MIVKVFSWTIKIYRIFISPMFPPTCRYIPTCSTYIEEALGKYGIIKGLFHGGKRLLRCHPFSKSGYDPLN